MLIAHSARMLAQSAVRAGWQVVAVDRFADLDTRRACLACYQVPSRNGRFDPEALWERIQSVLAEHKPQGWLYGSGMDALPDLIEQLAKLCPLFGNRAEAVRACVNPRVFFPLLDRLEIPYPEICWHAPKETAESFLVKQGGEGGTGVSVYRGEEVPGAYYQRRVAGKAYTLAFLAGSGQLWWYGFNTLYQTEYNDRPFLFAGIINRADLPPKVKKTVVEYAQRLSSALSLTGLQGLDFMVEGEVPKVLELNPRPGAALGLWDGAWPSGLMAAQVKLSQGEAVGGWRKLAVKGSKIVFAKEAVQIPCDFSWPRWCADLALPGTKIPAGGPICTVGASGATVAEVEAKLYARINWITQALERKNDAETSFSQP